MLVSHGSNLESWASPPFHDKDMPRCTLEGVGMDSSMYYWKLHILLRKALVLPIKKKLMRNGLNTSPKCSQHHGLSRTTASPSRAVRTERDWVRWSGTIADKPARLVRRLAWLINLPKMIAKELAWPVREPVLTGFEELAWLVWGADLVGFPAPAAWSKSKNSRIDQMKSNWVGILHKPFYEEVKISTKFQLQKTKAWAVDLKMALQNGVFSILKKVDFLVLVGKLVEPVTRDVPMRS
jgi:hypothetical protein